MSTDINRIIQDVTDRVKGALTAFVYSGSEGFDDMKQQGKVPPLINQIMNALYAIGFVAGIVFFVIALGAAHLSMCYNSYLGVTDASTLYVSAAIAFALFPIYYPYYAFVLNPLCVKGRVRR